MAVEDEQTPTKRQGQIPLSEVILSVANEDEMAVVRSAIASLAASGSKLVSVNKVYQIDVDSRRVSFRVDACFPVCEGVLTLHTRVVVFVAAVGWSRDEDNTQCEGVSIIDEVEALLFSPLGFDLSLGRVQPSIAATPHALRGSFHQEHECDQIIVLNTAALVQLGVAEDHYVSVSPVNTSLDELSTRLCRVRVDNNNIIPSNSQHHVALLSPFTIFNLKLVESSSIRIQRVGPEFTHASIPRASHVTVARIAGPLTTNMKYLDLCLDALKNWVLGASMRLVAVGDVIGVLVDELNASIQNEFYCNEDLDIKDDISFKTDSCKSIAFFKVVAMSHEPLKEGHSKLGSCFIDVNTQMVESGLVASPIPKGINSYFGIKNPVYPANASPSQTILIEIFATFFHPLSPTLGLDCSILLSGPPGSGKSSLLRSTADALGAHILSPNCYALDLDAGAAAAYASLDVQWAKARAMAPCVFVLRGVEALLGAGSVGDQKEESSLARALLEWLVARRGEMSEGVAIVATTGDVDKVPKDVQGFFRNEVVVEVAADALRNAIIEDLTQHVVLSNDIDKKKMTIQTAGLVPGDLVTLIARALSITVDGLAAHLKETDSKATELDVANAGLVISSADFEKALSFTKKTQADTIGAPSIPNVTWDDIGGLSHIRASINDTIQLPLERPELFASGMKKRSGILLFGPPGTGKTLIAKAVATTFSLNFLSVKGPELLNMYIGESEANVRRIFQQARNAKPCVIFFDELDSVAPKRGDKGDSSGGVMDRIVSQLLAELDSVGSTGGGDVFVIGATNRPDLLDSALLRPGRFDKMLYLGVSEEKAKQVSVLQALTRKFALEEGLDLGRVADHIPAHLTGADLYALCSDAMLKAMSRTIRVVDDKIVEHNEARSKEGKTPLLMTDFLETVADSRDKSVIVNENDFLEALAELKPSLTPADLAHYAKLQDKFK